MVTKFAKEYEGGAGSFSPRLHKLQVRPTPEILNENLLVDQNCCDLVWCGLLLSRGQQK